MPVNGYDAFFLEPGESYSMNCRVCGAQCRVQRSRLGPTSFVEAMGGSKRPHDLFTCPHTSLIWHDEALELLRAAEAEPDPLLAKALNIRLRRLLNARLGR
jgi:hypothetical protein